MGGIEKHHQGDNRATPTSGFYKPTKLTLDDARNHCHNQPTKRTKKEREHSNTRK